MMIGATLNAKPLPKYSPAANSQGQASLSAKKKPFARKPASSQLSNTSEKKRRQTQEQMENAIMGIQQFEVEPSHTDASIKINFVKRKERQTQNYLKQKEASFQGQYKFKKDTSYSPITSKKNLFDGVTYFSKNPSTRHMESFTSTINPDLSYASTPSSSRIAYQQSKTYTDSKDYPLINHITPRKKVDSSFLNTSNNNQTLSYSKIIRSNAVQIKNPPKIDRIQHDNLSIVQCIYCKNNKEATDIMCEKYSNLEKQLIIKDERIRDLTIKLETLKEEYSKLNDKYENKLESCQLKEIQYFREREEMMGRIDNYKSDIIKLTQRLKYTAMQNDMLLRFKDQIQLMEKEYDLMMTENQRLQKTIAQLKRIPPQEKFKKNKHQNQYQIDKKNSIPNNIPYLFNGKVLSQKYTAEDDLVSLSLSQRSFDQF